MTMFGNMIKICSGACFTIDQVTVYLNLTLPMPGEENLS